MLRAGDAGGGVGDGAVVLPGGQAPVDPALHLAGGREGLEGETQVRGGLSGIVVLEYYSKED